jgi:peptidoglycan/xylan/chitin deacetylase (PgdA/CDA1 family)
MSIAVRRCLACRALVLALALALFAPPGGAQAEMPEAGDGAKMCWPAQSLAFRPGEERIQRAPRPLALPARAPIAEEPLAPNERLPIRRVKLPRGVKLIALTFDLCEQPFEIAGYQGSIVDYLRMHHIRATFFAGGKWMLSHEERTQQLLADPLFEIGNHSWEHRNLRLLAGDALIREIEGAETAYEKVREDLAGRRCLAPDSRRPAYLLSARGLTLFRFPFGACNPQALAALGDRGLRAIQWDVSSGDPSPGESAEHMAKAVLAEVRPGSIVVFHANGRGWHTPTALPMIVEALQAQGYGFATVSELLASGEPVTSATCYNNKPGDTDRYDKIAQHLATLYDRWRDRALAHAR